MTFKILAIKNIALYVFVIFTTLAACTKEDSPSSSIDEGQDETLDFSKNIPIGHNSWIPSSITKDKAIISDSGIHNWSSLDDVVHTFVKTGSGKLNVGFKIKSTSNSTLKVTIGNTSKEITISNSDYATVPVADFEVDEGYQLIKIEGLEKSGTYIADINELLLGGDAATTGVNYVPKSNYHFGRRGPSVHLTYNQPQNKEVQWFYNEVTVPDGQAKLGSFFMATGHSHGYFGMQVNSETERRVLFSIWSAYETDDPNQVPDDYKVTTLGHGEGVTVQPFGNEGSGMQSFIDVDWKEATTYKFLLKGEPSSEVSGATDFTGYFYDPAIDEWKLIASLRKPKTSTHLKRLHSFLENFSVNTGYQSREVHFSNQWAYTKDGSWEELTKAIFTNDATAANGDRLDYAGGEKGEVFFLKNCGFFNDNSSPNTNFTRVPSGKIPSVDFSSLPKPHASESQDVGLLDREGWSIKEYSSQEDGGGEGETGRAIDILDGDLNSYWHSCWTNDCSAKPPHHITIDMTKEQEISGIRFYQRQSLSRAIESIEIKISNDNSTWESLGSFQLENLAKGQDFEFEEKTTFRYLKCIVNSSQDQSDFAALAELQPFSF